MRSAGTAYIPGMTQSDPRAFLYRDTLDPDTARRVTADVIGRCDDGELYLQYAASESFGFDDGRLKTADFNTQAGFGLRGVTGETTAFAHANEISEAAIRRAGETMQLLDPRPARAASPRAAPMPGSTPATIRSPRSRSRARWRSASRSTPPPARAIRASSRSRSGCRDRGRGRDRPPRRLHRA
jgi:hypothetical protein